MSLNKAEIKKDGLDGNFQGRVVKEKGKWIARLDDKGLLVLPDALGRMMNLALKMEEARGKDWNPNRIAASICRKFNCHKLTFFLLSTILGNQGSESEWQKAKKAVYDDKAGVFSEINVAEGIKVTELSDLKEKIKNKLKNKDKKTHLALLQIWQESFDKKNHPLLHSCLIGIDTAGRLVCLEKQGFDYGKIQCVSLDEMVPHEPLSLKEIIWGIELVDDLTIDIANMEMVLMRNFKRLNDMHCKNILYRNLNIIKEDNGDFAIKDLMHLLIMEYEKWARNTHIILRYLLEKGMIREDELISEVLAKVNQLDLSDIQ